MANRPPRREIWRFEDGDLLIQLIQDRIDVINSTNRDRNTNEEKRKKWEEIHENFNNMCVGGQRTVDQLKSKWKDIKHQERELERQYEHERDVEQGAHADLAAEIHENNSGEEEEIESTERDVEQGAQADVVAEISENNSNVQEEIESTATESKEDKLTIQRTNDKFEDLMLTHKTNIHDENIKTIDDLELQCRKELHLLQIENEIKKGLNLNLENELLKTKIMVYKKQLDGIHFSQVNNIFKQ